MKTRIIMSCLKNHGNVDKYLDILQSQGYLDEIKEIVCSRISDKELSRLSAGTTVRIR